MNTSETDTFHSNSPEETQHYAAELAKSLKPGRVLALHGPLGAGKTCFVKGLAQGLGISKAVTSPTFTLVNEYRGEQRMAHIDLYRLYSSDEVLASGLEDYYEPDGLTVIEWAERAKELLPSDTLHVTLTPADEEESRVIEVKTGNL